MTLTCHLLSHTQILDGTEAVSFPTERSRALFVYLALHPGQEIGREHLAGLFWPGNSSIHGRRNLRGALSRARAALGDAQRDHPVLHPSRRTIVFDASDVWVDVLELQTLLDHWLAHQHDRGELCIECAESLEKAVALYRGPLLQDVFVAEAQPFEEWLVFQRELLHNRVIAALMSLLEMYTQRSDQLRVVAASRRLVELAPWQESAHIRLMEALVLNGQRGAALQHYHVACQLLHDELDAEPGPELERLYNQLRAGASVRAAPEIRQYPLVNPYRGLQAFQQEHADCFFGRETITERLLELVRKLPVVTLIGPSGSGKSSVLQAGLMPRLLAEYEEGGRPRWQVVRLRPGNEPFHALVHALAPLLHPPDDPADLDLVQLAEDLATGVQSLQALCKAVQQRLLARDQQAQRPPRLLIVVDQAEEIFTMCADPLVREAFLDTLLDVAYAACDAPGMGLLLAMRADFMGEALRLGRLAEAIQQGSLLLGPMQAQDLRRAIEKPARMQGVHFEPGLVDRLLVDIGDQVGSLPLLEFTLTQLWDMRRQRWITHQAYEDLERLGGALTHYADGVYARLNPEEQALARRSFLRLVVSGQGADLARRIATRREIGERAWRVVQMLAASRLVITDQDPSGNETAELVHEALARSWPQLRGWLEEDRAFQVWRQRLDIIMAQWQESVQDRGALLRGAPLAEAERWLAARADDLSGAEVFFITASLEHRTRQQARQEETRRAAQRLARLALGRQLSAQAHLLANSRVDLALLLNLEALKRLDAPLDRRRLLTGLVIDPRLITFLHRAEGAAYYLEALQDSQHVVFATENSELWRLSLEHPGRAEQLAGRPYLAVRVAPSGGRAALVDPHEILVWDTVQDAVVQCLPRHWGPASAVCFSGDGRLLFTSDEHGRVSVWDVASGARLRSFSTPDQTLLAAVNHDGSRVAVTCKLMPLILDTFTGQTVSGPMEGHRAPLHDCTFSPDGKLLATASFDGTARLWEVATGAPIGEPLIGHQGRVLRVKFRHDGKVLATAATDNQICLWSTKTGKRMTPPLVGHSNWVRALAFLPDGGKLVSGDVDGNVLFWDIACPQLLEGHTDRIMVVVVSPDGSTLVTASHDRRLGVWDAEAGELLRMVDTGHAHALLRMAFHPQGHRLAVGDASGKVSLWDVHTWQPIGDLRPTHEEAVIGMAFSPTGDLLATGDFSGSVVIADGHNGTFRHRWQAFVNGWALGMVFHPTGRMLAVGSTTGAIRLWDMDKGEPAPTRFDGHSNWVTDLVFTPDGHELISASSDNTIRAWDVATGESIGEPLSGHSSQVWQICFDPSRPEPTLVSMDSMGDVLWWDWARREPLGPALHTGKETESMALSPDGRRLYLGSFDATAQVWRVPSEPWAERAAAIANRALTEEERRYHLVES